MAARSFSGHSSASSKLLITATVLLLTTVAFLRDELTALASLNLDYSFFASENVTALSVGVGSFNNDSRYASSPTSRIANDSASLNRDLPWGAEEVVGKASDVPSAQLLLDEATVARLLRNSSILSIQNLSISPARRSQLQLADIDTTFLADLRLVHYQLNYNYDPTVSNCKRISTKKMAMGGACFGLGTQVGRFNRKMLRRVKQGRQVFHDIDSFTCGWFERDRTKECNTMFGDCYFPALTTRGRRATQKETGGNGTADAANEKTCHGIQWFGRKHGEEALYAAHFSWLMGDIVPDEQQAVPPPEPCIALHIRRGDACINADRQCFSYDTYYRAVQFMVHRYPQLQRLVVLTDGDDFPLEQFRILVSTIDYPTTVNRSKYNVLHLRNESIEHWAPEHRNLDNATSELLDEVARASQCTALVGTFTAGISKWIWLLHMTRQAKVPLFYSLQGCTKNAWESGDFTDEGCEGPLF
jgi:hypothetical protein